MKLAWISKHYLLKHWFPVKRNFPGHKKSKDGLTLLVATNSSENHKNKLFVIVKAAKPNAFKHVLISSMPVMYKNQKSVWMTQEI